MNTLTTLEIAHTEQAARVQHAMHLRALRTYQRENPVEHHRRALIASLLRRLATRLDGRTAAAPGPRIAPGRRLTTR
jgi:hypothetical protein